MAESAARPHVPTAAPNALSTIGYRGPGALHPAVAMAAVGPVTDEVKGELARAYVVLRPDTSASEAELIDFCRPQLAAYKVPRSVRFVADLPKTSTGKIMRRELRTLP
ncbi:MAG: AMP-binding enzyme [Longimicrobiales bacterium]